MNHPVKECIQKLGLTHRAFVVLYDISWERFRSCLYGYTNSIPRAILNVVLQNGYDEQEAQWQYFLWGKWRIQQELTAPRRHRWERESMRLPLDTVLFLMRRENVLGHGFDLDELSQIFVKYVRDPMSQEQVELSLAHYIAKSKHNDVVHRNQVLTKFAQFLNQYDWRLSDDHIGYYRKYLSLFG